MITIEQVKEMERECDQADKQVDQMKINLADMQAQVRKRVLDIEAAYRELRAQKKDLTTNQERITV